MRLGSKLRSVQTNIGSGVTFWCPGCDEAHAITTVGLHAWGYNGNADCPTFTPSVLVTGVKRLTDDEHDRVMAGEEVQTHPSVCHSFVNAGQIQFLNDCTHSLAGTTVPLPDFPT